MLFKYTVAIIDVQPVEEWTTCVLCTMSTIVTLLGPRKWCVNWLATRAS